MKFLDMFAEDCKYYDIKNIEVKTILKYAILKGKTILDIGAGIGRLSFPLSRHAKEVIALDKDKRFREYFEKHKKKNVRFINKTAEHYIAKDKKFDIILLAWPAFNLRFMELIKKAMHKDSLFVFITCDNNSDFETIVDKLKVVKKGYFNKDINDKEKFIGLLSKKFRLLIKKRVNTEYIYPNEKTAFRVLKNDMKLWFNAKLHKNAENRLKQIIEKHKKGKKVIFKEVIRFYLMKRI